MRDKRQVIKKVMKSGNAGSVYVPREWIDQQVLIRLFSVNGMILEALTPHLKNILGIYLHGPHARGEETQDTDIDALIITDKNIALTEKQGLNIQEIRIDEIPKYIKENPATYHTMIREAIPIMNETLLESLKDHRLEEEDIQKYYQNVEKTLNIAKELELDGDLEGAAYTLIHRLRGMYMIQCTLRNKDYSHKGLEDYIAEAGINRSRFRKLYETYKAKETDKIPAHDTSQGDIRKLHKIAEKILRSSKIKR